MQQPAGRFEGIRLCNDRCKQFVPIQSPHSPAPVAICVGRVCDGSWNEWLRVSLLWLWRALPVGVPLARAHSLCAPRSLVISVSEQNATSEQNGTLRCCGTGTQMVNRWNRLID